MSKSKTYEVIVSNWGCVYSGPTTDTANAYFEDYVNVSKTGKGRAGGESVTLMCDGEPVREYFPELEASRAIDKVETLIGLYDYLMGGVIESFEVDDIGADFAYRDLPAPQGERGERGMSDQETWQDGARERLARTQAELRLSDEEWEVQYGRRHPGHTYTEVLRTQERQLTEQLGRVKNYQKGNMKNRFIGADGPMSLTELSKFVGQFRDGTTNLKGDALKDVAMELCEAILVHVDQTRDQLTRETLRGWIGRVQAAVGLQ